MKLKYIGFKNDVMYFCLKIILALASVILNNF